MESLSNRILDALQSGGSGHPAEVARRDGVGASPSDVTAVLETLEALHKVKRSPGGAYYIPGHPRPAGTPLVAPTSRGSANSPAALYGSAICIGDLVVEPGRMFTNKGLMQAFGVSNSGGMRRSLKTNTLLLMSHAAGSRDKQPYQDRWHEDVLHYTGMGMSGDQDLKYMQNATLAGSDRNGVLCLLFDSPATNEYVFIGRAKLAAKPYEARQPDSTGMDRRVWMFPLRVTD